MKRVLCILLMMCILVTTGHALGSEAPVLGTIERHPPVADYSFFYMDKTFEEIMVPNYSGLYDLRSADLQDVDLSTYGAELNLAMFDSATIWPEKMPDGFDADKIMTLGKDPGRGVDTLHARGLTGKNMGIAIIDDYLLVDHIEYADRVRYYEEYTGQDEIPGQMHSAAVSSIALGETVGVAPEALLYFMQVPIGKYSEDGTVTRDYTDTASAIERFIALNEQLPEEEKIRVISMSINWKADSLGAEAMDLAIQKAEAAGIVCCSVHNLMEEYLGLGRDPYGDPNDIASAKPGMFWETSLYTGEEVQGFKTETDLILVPMDARCVASPTGTEDYVFYPDGGMSWLVPYVSGLYVLACQASPGLTFDAFTQAARETAVPVSIEHEGKDYPYGFVLDAVALFDQLEK